MLTPLQVKLLFDYNSTTGILTWRIRSTPRLPAGTRAGTYQYTSKKKPSKRTIMYDGKAYNEANIIWCWMTGVWPAHIVDHIDLDPFNNIWSNLRSATKSQNGANRNGNVGHAKWVRLSRNGKYEARVKQHQVGTFDTEQEAHDAAYAFARKLYGPFARG